MDTRCSSDWKTVLMPRRHHLTQLDLEGKFNSNAPRMRDMIRPYAEEYKRVVLKDQIQANMDVKGEIKAYHNFKLPHALRLLPHHLLPLFAPRAAVLARRTQFSLLWIVFEMNLSFIFF